MLHDFITLFGCLMVISWCVTHSQFMTNLQVGQVFSCWSNVSRLRFDQQVGQLSNFWQGARIRRHQMTKIWPTFDQDLTRYSWYKLWVHCQDVKADCLDVLIIFAMHIQACYIYIIKIIFITVFLPIKYLANPTTPTWADVHIFHLVNVLVSYGKRWNVLIF